MNDVKYIKRSDYIELGTKIQSYEDKLLEITAKINDERSRGDLSENSEYQNAMQSYRIALLERNELLKKYNESQPVDDTQYRLEYCYGENHLCDGDIVRIRIPSCGIPELEQPAGTVFTIVEDEDAITWKNNNPVEICTHTMIGEILTSIKFPPRKTFLSNSYGIRVSDLPSNFGDFKPDTFKINHDNSRNYRDKDNVMRRLIILDYEFFGEKDDFYPNLSSKEMVDIWNNIKM